MLSRNANGVQALRCVTRVETVSLNRKREGVYGFLNSRLTINSSLHNTLMKNKFSFNISTSEMATR
jgi:hypothetical protein